MNEVLTAVVNNTAVPEPPEAIQHLSVALIRLFNLERAVPASLTSGVIVGCSEVISARIA
jgi:hypothetical protein